MRDGNLGLLKKLIGLEEGQKAEVGKIEQCTCPQTTMKYWNIPARSALDCVFAFYALFSQGVGNGPLFSAISGEIGQHIYSRY